MFRTSEVTSALFVLMCMQAYALTPAPLFADMPVRVQPAQALSPESLEVGHYIYFQVSDAVCGDSFAIAQGADVIAEITDLHKSLLGRITAIEIRFLYIRTTSGEHVPVYRSRYLQTDWKVRLVRGTIPFRTQATVFVSRDFAGNTSVTNESTRRERSIMPPVRWNVSR